MTMRRSGFAAAVSLAAALAIGPAAVAMAEPNYPPSGGGGDATVPPTESGSGGDSAEAGGNNTGGLADTGSDVASFATVGLGAIALGTGAVVIARRRRQGS